jgi:hypothetical protein
VSRKKGGRKSASSRAAEGKPKDLDGAMASLAGKNILRGSVRRAVRPSVGFATPPDTGLTGILRARVTIREKISLSPRTHTYTDVSSLGVIRINSVSRLSASRISLLYVSSLHSSVNCFIREIIRHHQSRRFSVASRV